MNVPSLPSIQMWPLKLNDPELGLFVFDAFFTSVIYKNE
jgi:hypothetical protein